MRRIYQYAWDAHHPADELVLADPHFDLPGCPDNLEWDEEGNLWVGAHPSFIILAVYAMRTPLMRTRALTDPLPTFEDGAPRIERVFDDDTGQIISGSTGAAVPSTATVRRLLIGAPFDDHFLDCAQVSGTSIAT